MATRLAAGPELGSMVKWYDGLFGGLLAGIVTATFDVTWESLVAHDGDFASYFSAVASIGLGSLAHAETAWVVAFGIVLHLIGSALAGIVYALIAVRVGQMWHAPASTLWGMAYGLLLWVVNHDVIVPLFRVVDDQGLVEGLIGTTLFYGFVISEYLTIVHRAKKVTAP